MGTDLDGKVATAARALGVELPQRGKLYDEIQDAIRKAKLSHPEVHNLFLGYCLMLTIILMVLFVWFMYRPSLSISIITAFTFELYFLNVFHTRHHQGGQLYRNETLHRLTTPLYNFIDAVWGYTPYAWQFQHHVRHHVYTNDADTDSDVPSMWPLVRSCHDQPMRWWHKAQTFYWPVLMPFTAVNFPVNNILTHGGSAFHFASWIAIMFVIPVVSHGWHCLFYSLMTQGIAGASLAYKFAVSHAHNNLRSTPTNKESYDDIDEWIAAQVEESISYGGFFVTCLFGGINMQIEHHIAPALDPPLYYFVSKEIKAICRRHGVKYTEEPTIFHAIWQFHRKLWSMGWSL
jgi:fatty acid desaturase